MDGEQPRLQHSRRVSVVLFLWAHLSYSTQHRPHVDEWYCCMWVRSPYSHIANAGDGQKDQFAYLALNITRLSMKQQHFLRCTKRFFKLLHVWLNHNSLYISYKKMSMHWSLKEYTMLAISSQITDISSCDVMRRYFTFGWYSRSWLLEMKTKNWETPVQGSIILNTEAVRDGSGITCRFFKDSSWLQIQYPTFERGI